MDKQIIQELVENGMDYQDTLQRFVNKESLVEKFLKKFLEDTSCQYLREFVDAKEYQDAFCCAHTLKGVAANLGLKTVQKHASEITELLRNKSDEEVDVQKLNEQVKLLEVNYQKVRQVIEKM